jgi:hypothetical protein
MNTKTCNFNPDYTTPIDTTTSIGVNPDFNAEALFLVKYMTLNEDDRFAIGHRF